MTRTSLAAGIVVFGLSAAASAQPAATGAAPAKKQVAKDEKETAGPVFGISGDLRLRDELSIERPDEDDPIRLRFRVRARVQGKVKLFDQLQLGARAVTGNLEEPGSTHQTMTAGFSGWAVSLDRVYAKWTPKSLGGSYLMAGKFAHPFERRPVYGITTWDGDIQPAGAVAAINVPTKTALETWKLVGGAYIFQENSGDIEDGAMFVGQTSFHFKLRKDLKLLLAGGLYYLPDTTPGDSTVLLGYNRGNATIDVDNDGEPDEFVEDFAYLDTLLGLKWKGKCMGVNLGAQLIANPAAADDNFGYGVGVAVPFKIAQYGSLKPYFDFQTVQREASFTGFNQDDRQLDAGYRGIITGIKYAPVKRLNLHAWVITGDSLEDDDGRWVLRTRLDLNVKF